MEYIILIGAVVYLYIYEVRNPDKIEQRKKFYKRLLEISDKFDSVKNFNDLHRIESNLNSLLPLCYDRKMQEDINELYFSLDELFTEFTDRERSNLSNTSLDDLLKEY